MASTFTQWARLEKIEPGTVDWDSADGRRFDEIDQGISGSYFALPAAERVNVACAVAFDASHPGFVVPARVRKASGKTRRPACGVAMNGSGYGGSDTIQIVRRGLVRYADWNWTPGERIFLGPDEGVLLAESDDNVVGFETDESPFYLQRIGYAVTPTTVFIDVTPGYSNVPHTVSTLAYQGANPVTLLTSGGISAAAFAIASGSFELPWHLRLPANFGRLPRIGAWAFRVRYVKTAGTVVDSSAVLHDDAGHSVSLVATAGWASATWAWREWNASPIADSNVELAAGRGLTFFLGIDASAGSIYVEPSLEFRFMPRDGGFE